MFREGDTTNLPDKPDLRSRRFWRQVKHKALAIPTALSLAGTPSAPIENHFIKATTMMVDHNGSGIPEVKEELEIRRKHIEETYNVELEGEWTIHQLTVMEKSFSKLPKSFLVAHPGKLASFNTQDVHEQNGYCECIFYADPRYQYDKYTVALGRDFFSNQDLADTVIFHELLHAKSLIHTYLTEDGNWEYTFWYEKNLEEALGMPFKDFSALAKIRLRSNFGNLYNYVRNDYTGNLSKYDRLNGPADYIEMLGSPKYLTLSKVARWMYAIGSLPGQTDAFSDHPIEFVAVMGEWYKNGESSFLQKTRGVLPEKQAIRIYYFMRNNFFDGYEYNPDGSLKIKPKQSTEQKFGTGSKR